VVADIRYTYTKAGFEQDVVLRQEPPVPEQFGLNPETTRLQVLTEFVASPLVDAVSREINGMTDQTLRAGTMTMGPGNAFSINAAGETSGSVPVAKQYGQIEGRNFLVEEAVYRGIKDQLRKLPPAKQYEGARLQRRGQGESVLAGLSRFLPPRHARREPAAAKPQLMARVNAPPASGFVMDYATINSSQTNFIFQGDTTYYISGPVVLYGTNVMEGNTVIKYAAGSYLRIMDKMCWETAPYRPAVLTAKDDNSAGETISGSTGNPSGYYASYAVYFASPNSPVKIKHTHIRHANLGIAVTSGGAQTHRAHNCQLWNVNQGVYLSSGTVQLENVLFHRVGVGAIHAQNSTVRAAHLTVNQAGRLLGGASVSAAITNSLFVWVTNWPTAFTSVNNATNNNSATFQTVGGGAHYLTANSPYRNVGTTNLNADLLARLRQTTTHPPIAYTNVAFTSPMTFSPQAQRDTDIPDLGYHYEPLDYSFGGCHVHSNITFTAGTAVGWFRPSSGWYHAGQALRMIGNIVVSFEGTATAPTYFVRLNTVQENDRTAGYGHGGVENWEYPAIPIVRGRFLRCAALANEPFNGYFADDYGPLRAEMTHTEFWSGALQTYGDYMYYTNCLMWRLGFVGMVYGSAGNVFVLRNSTMIGGRLEMQRTTTASVSVRDCAFDGTSIMLADYYGSHPAYTDYDYNAYTNAANPFPIGGSHDVGGVAFNWQASWLGDFYLPSDSILIDAGSVTADAVGLYHFTTQTNEYSKEEHYQVDIGYHYVGVDWQGKPLAENGGEIADYLMDTDGDGLDDTWELTHFGDLNQFASGDYDSDGISNLDEFNAGSDPNTILFYTHFENLRIGGHSAHGTNVAYRGVPAKMAILLDNPDFGTASWTSYNSNFSVYLGSTNGEHKVYVGLKGLPETSVPVWAGYRIVRDATAPAIVITNPVTEVVFQSLLQLEGYSPEPLSSLRYDLINTNGILTNQPGYVVKQYVDPNSFQITTNWFACQDIELAVGTNAIILYATDRAGNVTTNECQLSYALPTNAPLVQLDWPQPEARVSGTHFTVRGRISDPTASVNAEIVAEETTNQVAGIVERDGRFWAQELPLAPGTNRIALTVTDAGNNVSVTNFTVFGSSVELSLTPLDEGVLNDAFITVSGTINVSDHKIWVNGVEVTNLSDGYWSVEGVPLPEGGTAVVQVRAIPLTDNDGNGSGGGSSQGVSLDNLGNPTSPAGTTTEAEADKPPRIVTLHYHKNRTWESVGRTGGGQSKVTENILWNRGASGYWTNTDCHGSLIPDDFEFHWRERYWDANGAGQADQGIGRGPKGQVCGVKMYGNNYRFTVSDNWSGEFAAIQGTRLYQEEYDETVDRAARTLYELRTGGKGRAKQKNLFVLTGPSVEGVGNPFWWETVGDRVAEKYAYPITGPIKLGSLGAVGADGRLYVALADNIPRDVTPLVEGNPYYTYETPGVTKHKLRIIANGVPLQPDRVVPRAEFCVGQKLDFQAIFTPEVPGLVKANPRWIFQGEYINHHYTDAKGCERYIVAPYWVTQNPTRAWYYNEGKKLGAAVGLYCTFENGQTAFPYARGKFDVYRPEVPYLGSYFSSHYGSFTLQGLNLFLSMGTPSGFDDGSMEFSATVKSKSKFPGAICWTQLAKVQNESSFPSWVVSSDGQTWLDGAEIYERSYSDLTQSVANLVGTSEFSDCPRIIVGNHYTSVNSEFITYLRFKPSTADAIWVTLRQASWSWVAEASYDSEGRPILPINNVSGPSFSDSTAFPVWTGNFTLFTFIKDEAWYLFHGP